MTLCTHTHTLTYARICDCLSGSLSVCLGIYLTFVKASRPQTDATLHVPRLPSSLSRVPCPRPVCVPAILCGSACFCCCPLFVCWPASSFIVHLIRFSMHVFSHLWLKHVNTQRAICLKCALWFMPSPSQIANFLRLRLHYVRMRACVCVCVWYVWYIYLLPSFGKEKPC